MTKSQFNIKIRKELLVKVKRQAMMSGRSLTEHITELITKSLSEGDNPNLGNNSSTKIKKLEERLITLESIVSNREYVSQKLKPFTNSEAINCTKFMRGLFDKEVEKNNFNNKFDAYEDLVTHIEIYDQLTKPFFDRLREIMIEDNPDPWTGKELNDLTGQAKCNCSIRKGLINWTGRTNCPSQQEICEKGEELLSLF